MEFKYTISNNTSNLKEVRQFVKNSLTCWGVTDADINFIVLAVDEICANVIIHALKNVENAEIELTITQKNDGVLIDICDKADYSVPNTKEETIEEIIASKRKGGIGLKLVNKIMDKIEYRTEEATNICTLFKKIQF